MVLGREKWAQKIKKPIYNNKIIDICFSVESSREWKEFWVTSFDSVIAEMAASVSGEPTRIMIAVNESSIKGYPHASISCRGAFDWTLKKIVRSNTSDFKLLFLHVQVPDEDGMNYFKFMYMLLFFEALVLVAVLVAAYKLYDTEC